MWGYHTLKLLCTIVAISISFRASADIFGEDNRKSINPLSSKYKLSKSVAVGVLNSLWTEKKNGRLDLLSDPLSDYMCKDERFYTEDTIYFACTGFLIAPDLLATAGHCAANDEEELNNQKELYCDAFTWYFGYSENLLGRAKTKNVDPQDVYKCKRIVYAINQQDTSDQDFAIIQLDRPVKNAKPLKLSRHLPKLNDSIYMIGHPMGLPAKLTDSARVFELASRSMKTNLDAFAGNSGSPVFNKNDEVIGILVGGNPAISTYLDEQKQCHRYNRCDEYGFNCKMTVLDGEGFPNTYSKVQSIKSLIHHLP